MPIGHTWWAGQARADRTVVSIQIFLADYHKDFKAMNEAYIAAFKGYEPLPVRTCVGIADLPGGHDIEMTVVSFHSRCLAPCAVE